MTTAENQLIESLPRADRLRLLKVCEPVELQLSDIVCEAARRTTHVYFPTDAFISMIRPVDGHGGLEVGMVGREGMVGAHLALGVLSTPLRALVQGPGNARRVTTKSFRSELERSPALQRKLHRYLHVVMEQLTTSAACLRFHPISARLARWLLMSQDRAHADTFHVTQEFLGYMLGVRRVGVGAAAGDLQRGGLIRYRRGEVTVLDRVGLEAAACSCYQSDQDAYRDMDRA